MNRISTAGDADPVHALRMHGSSRRRFLTGAAGTGLAVGMSGLLTGCGNEFVLRWSDGLDTRITLPSL